MKVKFTGKVASTANVEDSNSIEEIAQNFKKYLEKVVKIEEEHVIEVDFEIL